jgi:hypothetical protein
MPTSTDFFSKNVAEDESGIGAVVFQRLCSEVIMICDKDWRTPAWRMEAIRQLQIDGMEDARAKGVKEALAFIPPVIEPKFKHRLLGLGWSPVTQPQWACYYLEL